jgi:hypothetical protein
MEGKGCHKIDQGEINSNKLFKRTGFFVPSDDSGKIVTKLDETPKDNMLLTKPKETNPPPTETVKDSNIEEIKKVTDQIPAGLTTAIELLNSIDSNKKQSTLKD